MKFLSSFIQDIFCHASVKGEKKSSIWIHFPTSQETLWLQLFTQKTFQSELEAQKLKVEKSWNCQTKVENTQNSFH